jgi:hypothetical protein
VGLLQLSWHHSALGLLLVLLLLLLVHLQELPAGGACRQCNQHQTLPNNQHVLAASHMSSHNSRYLRVPAAAPCHGLACTLQSGIAAWQEQRFMSRMRMWQQQKLLGAQQQSEMQSILLWFDLRIAPALNSALTHGSVNC